MDKFTAEEAIRDEMRHLLAGAFSMGMTSMMFAHWASEKNSDGSSRITTARGSVAIVKGITLSAAMEQGADKTQAESIVNELAASFDRALDEIEKHNENRTQSA